MATRGYNILGRGLCRYILIFWYLYSPMFFSVIKVFFFLLFHCFHISKKALWCASDLLNIKTMIAYNYIFLKISHNIIVNRYGGYLLIITKYPTFPLASCTPPPQYKQARLASFLWICGNLRITCFLSYFRSHVAWSVHKSV